MQMYTDFFMLNRYKACLNNLCNNYSFERLPKLPANNPIIKPIISPAFTFLINRPRTTPMSTKKIKPIFLLGCII